MMRYYCIICHLVTRHIWTPFGYKCAEHKEKVKWTG